MATSATIPAATATEQAAFIAQVDARRREFRMPWKQLCKELGIEPKIVTRLKQGEGVRSDNIFLLSAWLRQTRP